ncbi:hypothetical protein [Aquitalea pelogenes]|nr:hypothetical protein [Aquitalea pelogenes]
MTHGFASKWRLLVEADDPAAEWISNDQAKAAWAEKVAKIKARIEGKQE